MNAKNRGVMWGGNEGCRIMKWASLLEIDADMIFTRTDSISDWTSIDIRCR